MKTLIIYDNTGTIRMTQAGDITPPESVAMAVVDVPDGKYPASVDPVTGEVILEDIPKTEMEKRLEALEAAVSSNSETIDSLVIDSLEG